MNLKKFNILAIFVLIVQVVILQLVAGKIPTSLLFIYIFAGFALLCANLYIKYLERKRKKESNQKK